ncbi:MAG: bifunctional 5,10-methylenetetrahydrofolate dehydrogenase/5,10-methenyltetrahydrofolate cyclohydrolase [bacterium]|nr:bifunctional 5,10-methylenetetrahydrofolate dehydrogenase/5,10-methenyltetrahydrofolate cyclohydrolase [bacterium]
MILLDGRKLAEKILSGLREEIVKRKKLLRLAVVVVGENPVTLKFIEQKTKVAKSIGVDVRVYHFKEGVTTNALRKNIAAIVREKKNSGVVIQLPLPPHINSQYILNAVPSEKDADVLSAKALGNFFVGKAAVLPPVVGAVKALFKEYNIDCRGKNIAVAGAGRLVGKPVVAWLINETGTVSIVNEFTKDITQFTRGADIIISGVGKPKLITGDMVKEGVVVIDAGTSEAGGKIAGDVDFDSVSGKAAYITPVPGGIGPVTVAMLLDNLVTLSKQKRQTE